MPRNKTNTSIRTHIAALSIAACVLLASVGIMGAATELSGAVISSGSIVVESGVKKVQHPSGGVVKDLLVADGRHVEGGELLVRLDETIPTANLTAVTKGYFELEARLARLAAERDALAHIEFPQDLAEAATSDASIATTMSVETNQFKVRREALDNRKKQLVERVAQLEEEIVGLGQQLQAKAQESELIQTELAGVEKLWNQNLVSITRFTTLQRDVARLLGDRGQLTAALAQSKGKIIETNLQILQIDNDHRRDVAKEFADVRAQLQETTEKRVAAQDVVSRLEIRAPQTGTIHELSIHTKGGVIGAGETIMLVVPDTDGLIIETRIAPQDVDQVKLGQDAVVRFPNFNQRTTPEIAGKVVRIGADVSREDKSAPAYFTVRVAIDKSDMAALNEVRLVPGMLAEVFIRTTERTMWSYLVKPIADQARRAFREK